MAEETSSPTVVPALTKTDAQALKSLVSRDTKILKEELEFRYASYKSQVNETHRRVTAEIEAERKARDEADQAELARTLAKIRRKVETINTEITATLVALEAAGWAQMGYSPGFGIPRKSDYQLQMPNWQLRSPKRDDQDLSEREEQAHAAADTANRDLETTYREAMRVVTGREADVLRDLTLQSITTEAAREFILTMPSSESLLPAPTGVEALPAPVDTVEA